VILALCVSEILALRKVLIFGNSGSGKSTLAKKICGSENLSHLDLDTLAWKPKIPPERKSINESESDITRFINLNKGWVIEGCYSDLLKVALPFSSEIVFMNVPVELCIENARNRPWEPHKYESKEAQDNNLEMLVSWISQYSKREDTFSEAEHKRLYEQYSGKKSMVTSNE
jgi:adenylate kinase family enzyme